MNLRTLLFLSIFLTFSVTAASAQESGESDSAASAADPQAAPSDAPPLRVAVVDLQFALNESDEGKRAIGQLEGFIAAKEHQLGQLEQEVNDLADRAAETRNARKKAELEQLLASKTLAYQESAFTAQQDMADMETKLRGKILEKLAKEAEQLARERGFTLVLEAGGAVWWHDAYDLTDELIERFNNGKGKGI